jgi:simple sugar transport system permease protein
LGLEVGRLHLGVLLALAVVPLVWLWLARTGTGFRIRAVGLNPTAAETAGIPVARTVAVSFLVSGALAGLGGGIEMLGQSQRLFHHLPGDPGYGFSGIAVALLGQLHPFGVLLSALFFGALAAGCSQMQRTAGISFHVAYVIQAVVVLFLISAPRLKSARRAPKAPIPTDQPTGG